MIRSKLFGGSPRDPARIEPMLKELEKAWKTYTDLRLGQLLTVCAKRSDIFYIEDDELLEGIREYINSYNNEISDREGE